MKINDVVHEWIDDAIKSNAQATGLDWYTDVSVHLMPGPDGNPLPMTSVLIALKSPLIGQYISNMALLPAVPPPPQAVAAAVEQLVTNVLDQRKEVMGLS